MTRALLPLDGYPERLLVLAEALTGGATRLSAVNTVLLGLRAGVLWDSPSGHAFEAAVQAPPPVIAGLIERYTGAARALRTLAAELEVVHHEVDLAIRSHSEAWRRHDVFLQRRDVAVDPVEQQDLERAMNCEVAVVAEAERRHLQACRRRAEADRACARTMRALARDALDDPSGYTWLATTDTVSKPVALVGGMLPGHLRLIGAGGVVAGAASRMGLLVLYDEGSWKEVAVNVLESGVMAFGSVLVSGSAVGVRVAVAGGQRVFTKVGNPTTGFRVGAGVRTTFDDWVRAWRDRVGPPVQPRPFRVPPRPVPAAATLSGKARNAATRAVDDAVLDGWRMATASGPEAQHMFVAGMTLKQTPKVVSHIDGAHDREVARREDEARRARKVCEVPVELSGR